VWVVWNSWTESVLSLDLPGLELELDVTVEGWIWKLGQTQREADFDP